MKTNQEMVRYIDRFSARVMVILMELNCFGSGIM